MDIITRFNRLPKIRLSPIAEQICKETNKFNTTEELQRGLDDSIQAFENGQIIMDLIDNKHFKFDNASRIILLFISNGDPQIASVLIEYFIAFFKQKGYSEIIGIILKKEVLTKGLPIPPEIRKIYKETLETSSKPIFDQLFNSDLIKGQGYFQEYPKQVLINSVMRNYETKIIRHYVIEDIVAIREKFLIKWAKRPIPLTDTQLGKQYRRYVAEEID